MVQAVEPPPEKSRQELVLQGIVSSCDKALELMDHPGYAILQEYYASKVQPYKQLLENVNTDKETRDRAAFALHVAKTFRDCRSDFERRKKDAESKLRMLAGVKQPQSVRERIFQFIR